MRYIDCCKSTRKNKKCTRKDGKHFSLQRRFTKKKCIKGPVKGFTMRASCAPYKFCKQKGGARKTRKLLPKLRKISYKNKKHHYRLKDPFSKRKLAIHEGVNREAKKTGKTKKKAAIAKKGRFNILRIYRKNKKIKECNTITHDMRYMDRKYGLGKTKNICGQKGGTYNFPPDRPDSTFSNIDDLKFILSFYSPHNNNKIIIKSYTGDEDEHQLEPELASDTHILIVGADHGIPFFLLQGAGFEIKPKGVDEYLTYVPPQQQGGSSLENMSADELKELLDSALSAHVAIFDKMQEEWFKFIPRFLDPNEGSIEEKLLDKYKEWRESQNKEYEIINYRHNEELLDLKKYAGIKNAIKEICSSPNSRAGMNYSAMEEEKFKLENIEKINEINKEHFFLWAQHIEKYKKLEKSYLKLFVRITEIAQAYRKKLDWRGIDISKLRFKGVDKKNPNKYRSDYAGESVREILHLVAEKTGLGYDGYEPDEILGGSNYAGIFINPKNHQNDEMWHEYDEIKDFTRVGPGFLWRVKPAEGTKDNPIDLTGGKKRKKKTRKKRGGRIPIEEKNFEEEKDPSTITIDEFEAQQQFLERERLEEVQRLRREQEENLRRRRIEEEEINPYEPEFHLDDEVIVEASYDDNGGIFDDDEATEFNIYDDETILDNIHYNPYSRWRVINIEFFEDDYPEYTLQSVDNNDLQITRPQPMLEAYDEGRRGGRRKKRTRKKRNKKQFLYNPDDPSKSFDVYIDKNPKDTIPIKYTTVKDVKDTIKKLERLYKTKKYPHKRIWQVGMIMKVRLEAMLKHKTKKYPNAKKVKQRFNLANKYFKFLGKRTKKKDFKSRKGMTFKF